MDESIEIQSQDYWFKVVEMLQQNWALIEMLPDAKYKIFFISDTSGIFDEIVYSSMDEATTALIRNGFMRYPDESEAKKFIHPPEPPFYYWDHPNGPIYSSGRFWQ